MGCCPRFSFQCFLLNHLIASAILPQTSPGLPHQQFLYCFLFDALLFWSFHATFLSLRALYSAPQGSFFPAHQLFFQSSFNFILLCLASSVSVVAFTVLTVTRTSNSRHVIWSEPHIWHYSFLLPYLSASCTWATSIFVFRPYFPGITGPGYLRSSIQFYLFVHSHKFFACFFLIVNRFIESAAVIHKSWTLLNLLSASPIDSSLLYKMLLAVLRLPLSLTYFCLWSLSHFFTLFPLQHFSFCLLKICSTVTSATPFQLSSKKGYLLYKLIFVFIWYCLWLHQHSLYSPSFSVTTFIVAFSSSACLSSSSRNFLELEF